MKLLWTTVLSQELSQEKSLASQDKNNEVSPEVKSYSNLQNIKSNQLDETTQSKEYLDIKKNLSYSLVKTGGNWSANKINSKNLAQKRKAKNKSFSKVESKVHYKLNDYKSSLPADAHDKVSVVQVDIDHWAKYAFIIIVENPCLDLSFHMATKTIPLSKWFKPKSKMTE